MLINTCRVGYVALAVLFGVAFLLTNANIHARVAALTMTDDIAGHVDKLLSVRETRIVMFNLYFLYYKII